MNEKISKMFLTGTKRRVYCLIVLDRHKTEKPEGTARGEKYEMGTNASTETRNI